MSNYNINTDLFKRYSPENKLKIIEEFTTNELLAITKATILRMIKEAGVGDSKKTRSKFKTLYFKATNNWNSDVTSVYNWKKDEIFMNVYIQGDDTDIDVDCSISKLLDRSSRDICFGEFEESYLNGRTNTIRAYYDSIERAEIIRAICTAYINNKYKDKLNNG